VFEDSEPVTITPAIKNPLVLVVDGNAGCYVTIEDQIQIVRAPYYTDLIRLKRPEFFRILREKLGWGLTHASKPTSVELP
jgi:NAD+ kinase